MNKIQQILNSEDKKAKIALFNFDLNKHTDEQVLLKFNLWVRHLFPLQFTHKDAPFHREIDLCNLQVYRGTITKEQAIKSANASRVLGFIEKQIGLKAFVDIVFRGGAKTTRTKMFFAFCILNDVNRYRKFWKILTKDISNAKQLVTDIYNILINPRVLNLYPSTFEKSDKKREETMASFTTSYGVKIKAGTVGTDQRGQVQGDEESARPDFIWFDDFETRKTLRSAVETKAIWDNMEEARTGLAKNGGCVYTCNYLSERGNVHKLVEKCKNVESWKLLIVPIMFNNKPMWDLYTMEDIEEMKNTDDDFAGERMCEPSASLDIMFDREILDRQLSKQPLRDIAGFKIFYEYNSSHRYGSGHDVSGGVGLDSSTSVFIDFSTIPARVVATFKSNTIKPDIFGDEIASQCNRYGECISAPENNNHGHATIGRLKQIYSNIFFQKEKETRAGLDPRTKIYGWNTNALTKPEILFALKKAVEDGQLNLTDEFLIAELKSYTRDDLMDKDEDPRLTTRHFDLLMACAIAWQMRNYAEVKSREETNYKQPDYEHPLNND